MSLVVEETDDFEAVQPYRMHVSSRYLDLTRRKLELTRLPRELQLPEERQWDYGTPKTVLEPLVDYWLEHYDWRSQESQFNESLPQFRTTVPVPKSVASQASSTLRLHFVHKKSFRRDAVPLLFCHGWPGTFAEVSPIIESLTEPVSGAPGFGGGEDPPAFHVVAPSIPGFGFSDASPIEEFGMKETAEVFDALMKRLGYTAYMVHGTGWGFRLARTIAKHHPSSCIAIHTVSPSLPRPSMRRGFAAWAKYHTARLTKAKVSFLSFGYLPSDFPQSSSFTLPESLPRLTAFRSRIQTMEATTTPPASNRGRSRAKIKGRSKADDLESANLSHPHLTAYSLCDSPVGLLATIMDALRPSLRLTPASLSLNDPNLATRRSSLAPPPPNPFEPPPPGSPSSLPTIAEANSPYPSPAAVERPEPNLAEALATLNEVRIDVETEEKKPRTWYPTDVLNWTMLHWLPGPEASLRWLRRAVDEVTANNGEWWSYSGVPLGISHFDPGGSSTFNQLDAAEPARKSTVTADTAPETEPGTSIRRVSTTASRTSAHGAQHQSSRTPASAPNAVSSFFSSAHQITPSPPMWASSIQNIAWLRRHSSRPIGVSPIWDGAADDIVLDLRDFVSQTECVRDRLTASKERLDQLADHVDAGNVPVAQKLRGHSGYGGAITSSVGKAVAWLKKLFKKKDER